MKPEWRTDTVVQMCQAMRESKDYSSLPILADALQDAGCDDEKALSSMRGKPSLIEAQRLVCLVYSDKTARAVKYLEWASYIIGVRSLDCEPSLDEDLPGPEYDEFEYVVNVGLEAIKEGMYCFNFDSGPEFFYYEGRKDRFFRALEIVTGVKVKDPSHVLFRCAC